MENMRQAVTEFARFAGEVTYESLPTDVVRAAKQRIADVMGIGLSGSRTQAAKILDYVKAVNQTGHSVIWGTGLKTSPEYAALANGTLTFHLELDDVHRTSHTHPGVSTIPADYCSSIGV